MAENAAPRTLIVKIGCAGDLHIEYKPASLERLRDEVTALNQVGGIVIYYREGPFQNASDAAMATFNELADLKPRILMGTKAPSEWGRLEWVEVQRNPLISRVFFSRGTKFLLSPAPTPEKPKPAMIIGGPLQPQNEDRFFKEMDLLVRADRVLETPSQQSQLAMHDDATGVPSLHLRLAYGSRRWASAYPVDEIPSNIGSFERDLWWLASETFGDMAGREISGQEALDAFS